MRTDIDTTIYSDGREAYVRFVDAPLLRSGDSILITTTIVWSSEGFSVTDVTAHCLSGSQESGSSQPPTT